MKKKAISGQQYHSRGDARRAMGGRGREREGGRAATGLVWRRTISLRPIASWVAPDLSMRRNIRANRFIFQSYVCKSYLSPHALLACPSCARAHARAHVHDPISAITPARRATVIAANKLRNPCIRDTTIVNTRVRVHTSTHWAGW